MTRHRLKTIRSISTLEGRAYATPEDVQAAIDNGADRLTLYRELFDYIGRKNVEDASCAAFVARRWTKSTPAELAELERFTIPTPPPETA